MLLRSALLNFFNTILDKWVFLRLKINQGRLIRFSEKQRQVTLEPTPLVRGTIEHYYHFVFDLLLPLSRLISATNKDIVFILKRFGPLSHELNNVFPERTLLIENTDQQYADGRLMLGMNPRGLRHLTFDLNGFSELLKTQLQIDSTIHNRVILIERLAPDDYYLKQANNRGSGTKRRSIKNHNALIEFLERELSEDYVFENVTLEGMPLAKQITLFSSAKLVIGQHGGGLTNIIWMQEGADVIEFGFRSRPHFGKICKAKKHRHHLYKDYKAKHINIKLKHFRKWMYSNEVLLPFLRS